MYQIATAEELRAFAEKVNDGETTANAILTANIDLNNQPWYPIGTNSNKYTGTFDGNGHTISGLYIDSDDDYQGLFGYVSGTVKDLSVSGSVKGNDYVGGVVGWNDGSVINCAFSGSVSGSDHVGGVVGDNGGTVENCYNTGSVSGVSPVGGVVGQNSGSVKNCYNIGEVSGNYVGGVVGYNDGNVENCYNTGKVTGSSDYSFIGGVVGYNITTVTGCYFLQTAGVNESLQGIGSDEYATGAAVVNDLNELCEALEDSDTWSISPFYKHPVLQANPEGGDGTAAHPYEIKTAAQLETFRDIVNGTNGQRQNKFAHAKLMNDIDLKDVCGPELDAETSWEPIGNSEENTYTGTFNGNGKTISGLYIDDSTANNQGLFGRVNGGTVQNLTVSGSVNSSGDYVGGIVGNNSGTFENCAFTGSVSGDWYVGGVVGNNNGGTVTGCIFSGSGSVTGVTGSYFVGGVVGKNSGSNGSVEKCHNTGSVSGSREDVGGVVGDNEGTVENCYNTGAVSGLYSGTGNRVGGVVGWNDSGANVENCYNTGSVNVIGNSSAVGGVVGCNQGGSVQNCYNTGTVTVTDDYVGGVVGWNSGNVTNCYNTGTVSGSGGHVGGVVGDNRGTVKNCYYQIDKGATVGSDGTTKDDTTTVAKTAAEFHSGEVAYLLQSNQTAGSSQVWGQAIGEDKSPVLTSDQEKNVYKVTINLNDSDSTENETRYTNSDLKALTPESRKGYTFDGWYDNKACTGEAVTTITDPITTLYAQWTANTYTVTLHTNDGTIAEGQNISSYTYGTGATLPTSVTREGYTFAGWYEKEDFTGDPVAAIGKDAMGDKTYWAKWEEVENPEPDPTPTPSPDPTPSGPSTDGSSGWDDIRDELENAENGDEITIDMGDETEVPAEIFESLAGKDVEISFDLGDIQWSVNGQDIPADANLSDLDLGVEMDSDGIPVDVVNSITGERGTVQMTLAHDGDFGFTMTLTAPLGVENAGYWANLYHYDEDADQLTFETAAEIDADGSVSLPMSHASQYAIVIDGHSHAAVDVSDLFIDIAPDAWYKDAVQYAYDNGLMTGVSATEFAPEATTTRAMIVSILARLEGVTTAEAAGFADVDDEWYATAVNWAANVGVVNGYEDNTFKPNTAITREQLAAILMNYAAYKGEDVSNRADLATYTDQPSTWAQEAMQWAVAEKLITGVTNDELQPQSSATRAQVAAILQRLLEA